VKALWKLILAFFVLGIVPGEDKGNGADAGGDAGDASGKADQGDAGDDNLDLDAGDAGADDGAQDTDDPVALKAQLATERKARTDAEKRAQDEARAREDAQRRAAPIKTGQTQEERVYEQEERDLADPKLDANRRWQIESNRTLRANKRASESALFQAHDVSDKTSFGQLAITKPALYKRYAERVEAEIVKMRAVGQNAAREAVLRFLIGEDALQGKFTKKAPPAEEKKGVDRGKSPGARSDVSARGVLTDRQKRAKRLEGVIL